METVKFLLSLTAILASAACMVLLFRGYLRRRVRLLMWSALCFCGLTLNNIALFCDMVVFPDIDLRTVRLVAALAGMLILLYGFIWEAD
ncbi:MAG: DUF5985 family protein [Terrimicrobiaceae bacterium]|nr:DUF5985 family protein [Terrimicrobiaceae bacterium]